MVRMISRVVSMIHGDEHKLEVYVHGLRSGERDLGVCEHDSMFMCCLCCVVVTYPCY